MGEVVDCIDAYTRRLERENREREAKAKDDISMLYVQSLQIMNMISHIMNPEKVTVQPLSAYYPRLFAEAEGPGDFTEQEKEEDKHKLTPEMELHKARMDDFIFRHNREISQKRGESSGRNDT